MAMETSIWATLLSYVLLSLRHARRLGLRSLRLRDAMVMGNLLGMFMGQECKRR